MSQTRKLAAILFSDVVGYTAMMRENETSTLQIIRKSREIQQPLVEKHHGKWLKEMGDGVMAQFNSALDAVNCAIEIQEVASHELDAQLRIGIHLGDITIENNEVYGDGVNLASRIESIAEPGSIYISEAVQGAIKGSNIHAVFQGEKSLKNVDHPIRVYKIVDDAALLTSPKSSFRKNRAGVVLLLLLISFGIWRFTGAGDQNEVKTIAVLPITMQGSDSTDLLLDQGITEELRRSLSKVKTLAVINPRSIMQLASVFPIADASSKLDDTDYFLSGSLERNNNMLMLDLTLFDHKEEEKWRHSYQGDIYEFTQLAGKIAVDVAELIEVRLSESETAQIVEIPTIEPELMKLLLLGRNHLARFTREDFGIGMNYLQQAVNEYPTSSRAWAMLAGGLVTMGHGPAPPPGVKEEAAAAALRAVQLDSLNAEAWAWLATTKTYYEWDYEGAQYCYTKANKLNPSLPMSHYHYSWHLYLFDSLDKAIEEHEKAFQLDPLDPFQAARLAHMYMLAGNLDKAEAEVERARRLNKNFLLTEQIAGMLYLKKQQYDSAEVVFNHQGPRGLLGLGLIYLRTGRDQEAMGIVESMKEQINPINAVGLAHLYAEMDSLDQFFEYANYTPTHAFHPWLRVEIRNPKILNDTRFEELMEKMNLRMPDGNTKSGTTFGTTSRVD